MAFCKEMKRMAKCLPLFLVNIDLHVIIRIASWSCFLHVVAPFLLVFLLLNGFSLERTSLRNPLHAAVPLPPSVWPRPSEYAPPIDQSRHRSLSPCFAHLFHDLPLQHNSVHSMAAGTSLTCIFPEAMLTLYYIHLASAGSMHVMNEWVCEWVSDWLTGSPFRLYLPKVEGYFDFSTRTLWFQKQASFYYYFIEDYDLES